MKDNDLRGEVLKVFYNTRSSHPQLDFGALRTHVMAQPADVGRICDQLAEYDLIKWKPIRAMGQVTAGIASITAKGVDVVEGTREAPISVSFHDRSITISGSTNVQIGNANSIQATIDNTKIIEAIDRSNASPDQKDEAKSLWSKLTNNAAFAAIVGAVATLASAAH